MGRGAGCPSGGALPTWLPVSLQGCRSRRCSRTPSTPSCPGSTAAAAKLARFSLTRSSLAWRRDSRSSATCPRQSGWSWPRPSACPRRRWAREELRSLLCPPLLSSPNTFWTYCRILGGWGMTPLPVILGFSKDPPTTCRLSEAKSTREGYGHGGKTPRVISEDHS